MKVLILDGYVDEPTCLGVPPFISPYVRNVYGLFLNNKIKADYKTYDEIKAGLDIINSYNIVVIICGCAVPGKYLGGHPVYEKELSKISTALNPAVKALLTGPVQYLDYFNNYHNMTGLNGYPSCALNDYFGFESKTSFPKEEWILRGAEVVNYHPLYPDLIAEIWTFSGCLRKTHCSFCIEGLKDEYHRKHDDIINELKILNSNNITRFRLGNQSDILSYNAYKGADERRINISEIEKLFYGIKENINYQVLHIDNVNPLTVVNYKKESEKCIKIISDTCTELNCAPLGLESADPEVVRQNSLKCFSDDVYDAVKLIYSHGQNKLLPGINIVYGLFGETKKTYELNYDFLKKIRDNNIILRRINIRKAFVHPKTGLSAGEKKPKAAQNDFLFSSFKDKVNKEIDIPMLKKVFPLGCVIKQAKVEKYDYPFSFARQIASYPITCLIPQKLKAGDFYDLFVINYHSRSIVCLPVNTNLDMLSEDVFMKASGISRKGAADIILAKKNSNAINMLPDYLRNNLKLF
jgi:radical SAM superfamily enzyme with C-terminal helix-hairpin-helix motif